MEDNDDRSEIATTEEQDTREIDTEAIDTEVVDTEVVDGDVEIDEKKESAGPDEVYCTSCGNTIKEAAEMCPHCGVRQKEAETSERPGGESSLSERRQYELEAIASKSPILGAILGCLLGPVGYIYVGKWGWALLSFFTFHFLFLGFLLTPLHILKIVSDAKGTLRRAGIGGY